MEVLTLLLFLGVVMVALALTFFGWTVRQGSLQHTDRLALLPLGEDEARHETTPREVDGGQH